MRSRTSHYANRININNIKTLAFAHEFYKCERAEIRPKYYTHTTNENIDANRDGILSIL